MDIDVTYDAGAYTTLSAVVLQRGSICANGVYDVPNLRVQSRAAKDQLGAQRRVPGLRRPADLLRHRNDDGARRESPGARSRWTLSCAMPPGRATRLPPRASTTSTCPRRRSRPGWEALSGYRAKREAYARQAPGRYRRGIGISLVFHGCAFTGNGERDLIKAVARIRGNADGTVDVYTANTEMGQGLNTSFPKLVAARLGIPVERVNLIDPDTDLVPDSGPTVASRSMMIVGLILRRAADKLKEQWKPGETVTIEEHYQHPDYMIPFSLDDFKGDAYPDYSWSGNAVEVEVDTLTGEARDHRLLGRVRRGRADRRSRLPRADAGRHAAGPGLRFDGADLLQRARRHPQRPPERLHHPHFDGRSAAGLRLCAQPRRIRPHGRQGRGRTAPRGRRPGPTCWRWSRRWADPCSKRLTPRKTR